MPTPAVNIEDVTHRYGDHTALDAVTLTVPDGELVGVLGPNGSGKTTLFRIISTLLPPTRGRAFVFGHDAARDPDSVRHRLGVVFQDCALDDNLTVRENLRFQGALYGLSGARLSDRIDALLDRFHVADRASDAVETLSGGLKRRVDLARGLLHRPDLLLLDEPTSGLDPMARRTFWNALDRLREAEGTTILTATHLMDEAARCGRVAILSDGALVADGSPDALTAELGDETLWLATPDPAHLRDRLQARFGIDARIIGSTVQVDAPDAPSLLGAIYNALGESIEQATLRRPTLEDVFVAHAGTSPNAEARSLLDGPTDDAT